MACGYLKRKASLGPREDEGQAKAITNPGGCNRASTRGRDDLSKAPGFWPESRGAEFLINAQHRCFSASTVDEITPCTRPAQLLEKVLVDSLDLKSVLDSTSDIVADHEFG